MDNLNLSDLYNELNKKIDKAKREIVQANKDAVSLKKYDTSLDKNTPNSSASFVNNPKNNLKGAKADLDSLIKGKFTGSNIDITGKSAQELLQQGVLDATAQREINAKITELGELIANLQKNTNAMQLQIDQARVKQQEYIKSKTIEAKKTMSVIYSERDKATKQNEVSVEAQIKELQRFQEWNDRIGKAKKRGSANKTAQLNKLKNLVFWDTETTDGLKNNSQLPVTLGVGTKNNLRKKSNTYTKIFDYGDDKKNIQHLIDAMSISDKKSKGFIDSSVQLRKKMGFDENVNLYSLEENFLNKKISEYLKANKSSMIKPEDFLKIIENGMLAGFNSSSFDIKAIENWLNEYYRRTTVKLPQVGKKILSKLQGNNLDIYSGQGMILDTFNSAVEKALKNSKGGKAQELLKGASSQKNRLTQFMGVTNQQSMSQLLVGKQGSAKHDAEDDVATLIELYKQFLSTNNMDGTNEYFNAFSEYFAKNLEGFSSNIYTKGKNGNLIYSEDFKNFAKRQVELFSANLFTVSNGDASQMQMHYEEVREQIRLSAKDRVRQLYTEVKKHNADNAKALTGEHLFDRMKKLGKGAGITALAPTGFGSELSLSRDKTPTGSSMDYLEQILNECEAQGIGTILSYNGSSVSIGFYDRMKTTNPEDKDIATIQLGLVDANGGIAIGNQQKTNLLFNDLFFEGKDGEKHPKNILSSAQEMQFKKLLSIVREETLDGTERPFITRLKTGDTKGANSLLGFIEREVFNQAPSDISKSDWDEISGDLNEARNIEQRILSKGLISNMEAMKSFYHYDKFKEPIDNLLENQTKAGKYKPLDPYNLNKRLVDAYQNAFMLVSNSLSDTDEFFKQTIERLQNDSITKLILTGEAYKGWRDSVRNQAKQGFAPKLASMKEEGYGAGLYAITGAQDIVSGGNLFDDSSRALQQVLNQRRKLTERQEQRIRRRNYFATSIGNNEGINYSGKNWEQYTFGGITQNEFAKAYREAVETLYGKDSPFLKSIPSIAEGGMVISDKIASELNSYQLKNFRIGMEDYDSNNKKNTNKINAINKLLTRIDAKRVGDINNLLQNMRVGDVFDVNKVIGDSDAQALEAVAKGLEKLGIVLNKGDLITGIEKTNDGFKLITNQVSATKTGTKLLGGYGERDAAIVLEQKLYNEIAGRLGLQNADVLREYSAPKTKNIGAFFQGKLSYILNKYQKSGKTEDEAFKELSSILSKTKTLKQMITLNGNTLDIPATYNEMDGRMYFNGRALGKDALNAALTDELRMVWEKMLGSKTYDNRVYMTALNQMRKTEYSTVVGEESEDELEQDKDARVKFRQKERDAFNRTVNSIIRRSTQDKADLTRFLQAEQAVQQNFGSEALQAQKDLEIIKAQTDKWGNITHNATSVPNYNANKRIVIGSWSEQDFAKIVQNKRANNDGAFYVNARGQKAFEWENGSVSTEQFNQSAIATVLNQIGKKSGEYKNATVVVDSASFSLGKGDIALPTLSAIKSGTGYIPDENSSLIMKLVAGDLTGEEFVEKLTENFKNKAYSNKSPIVKAADTAYVGHGGYHAAVAKDHVLDKEGKVIASEENTVEVTSNRLRELLSANGRNVKRNIGQLQQLLNWWAEDGSISDSFKGEIGTLTSKEAAKLKGKELSNLQQELINAVIKGVTTEGTKLLGQLHRYPSTSGNDIQTVRIGVNDNLKSDSALAWARGLAYKVNGDQDGDQATLRALLGWSSIRKQSDYNSAMRGAAKIEEIEAAIAKDMGQIDLEEASLKNTNLADKDFDNIVSEWQNKNKNIFVSQISKANKKYVGMFSNISTNVRGALTTLGFDENNPNASAQDLFTAQYIRAFTEALEQDAISAKKVAKRVLASKGGNTDAAFDDLQDLYNKLVGGKFAEAFAKAKNMGILEDLAESRHFRLADSRLRHTYGQDIFDEINKNNSVFTSGKVLSPRELKKLSDNDRENNSKLLEQRFLGAFEHFDAVQKQLGIDFADIAWNNTEELMKKARIASAYSTAKPMYGNTTNGYNNTGVLIRNTEDYEDTHRREIIESGYKDYILKSVTGVLNGETRKLTDAELKKLTWKQQDDYKKAQQGLEFAALQGTYGHDLLEMYGKMSQGQTDLSFEAFLERSQKERALLQSKINSKLLPDQNIDYAAIEEQASQTAAVAQKLGFNFSKALQEQVLGLNISPESNDFKGILTGQLDGIDVDKKTGNILLADWKFSKNGSPLTRAERIMQANSYLVMIEENLDKLIGQARKEGDQGKVAKLKDLREAFNKGAGYGIFRTYEDTEKGLLTEVTSGQRLDKKYVTDLLYNLMLNGNEGLSQLQSQNILDLAEAKGLNISYYNSLLEETTMPQKIKGSKKRSGLQGITAYASDGSYTTEQNKLLGAIGSIRAYNASLRVLSTKQEALIDSGKTSEDTEVKELEERIREINNSKAKIVQNLQKHLENVLKALGLDKDTAGFDIETLLFTPNRNISEDAQKVLNAMNISSFAMGQRNREESNKLLAGDADYQAAGSRVTEKVGKYKQLIDAETKLYDLQKKFGLDQDNITGAEQVQLQLLESQVSTLREALGLDKNRAVSADELEKEYSDIRQVISSSAFLSEKDKTELLSRVENYRNTGALGLANIDTKNAKATDKLINQALRERETALRNERAIKTQELKMGGLSGAQKVDAQRYLNMLYGRRDQFNRYQVDVANKTINGSKLSPEQWMQYQERVNSLLEDNAIQNAKIEASQKRQVGFLGKIVQGFKASLRNLIDYSLAYSVIGYIRQSFTQIVQTAQQLDAAMVNLQIASGATRREVEGMMTNFNALAKELGRSTQEVATAANDWLRAGYEGAEAAQLTKASMELSTLGMIESSQATSYLISVLKGWKLQTEDVENVVSKLAAVDMAAA